MRCSSISGNGTAAGAAEEHVSFGEFMQRAGAAHHHATRLLELIQELLDNKGLTPDGRQMVEKALEELHVGK